MNNPLRVGRHQKTQRTVAIVEGTDRGVPFRILYKRMDAAERDAMRFNGELLDLNTGVYRRWIPSIEEWRNVL
jgi:hypothetical protein